MPLLGHVRIYNDATNNPQSRVIGQDRRKIILRRKGAADQDFTGAPLDETTPRLLIPQDRTTMPLRATKGSRERGCALTTHNQKPTIIR